MNIYTVSDSTYKIVSSYPKIVGRWKLGPHFFYTSPDKPSRWQRFWVKFFFGGLIWVRFLFGWTKWGQDV